MKKNYIFLLMLLLLLLSWTIITTATNEQFPTEKIANIPIIELHPEECYSYHEFAEQDQAIQKKASGIWNTITPKINLDDLKIKVTASSTLGKAYQSTNIIDKKLETAWVEGVKGSGKGEWVKLTLNAKKVSHSSTPFSISSMGIIPGYAKNQTTWNENNRVKTMLVVIYTPASATQENEWVAFRLFLKDENKLQLFEIPIDYIAYNFELMTKTVWFKIEDVYKGTKYDDTCISEIVLRGGCEP
jgi:hypothetical protein